ncbi:MAG TPA: cell division protein ZapA [Aurantimonas sp.]|uniref:Cell division protein ZapA n=1 Tax=Aurantimonas marianensis TaxID=2920428 RepID=A0A9X2H6X6_9HYPH|nr:cell division protein ZapA [Aurantimonas marianensis]MCP3056467.1 cell division protein ZapA [Aurantimonas marianensis]
MPQIVVTIDEKTYRMACGEGEEAHLTALAAEVDGRIADLRKSFGQIDDLRLMVMAAIMGSDELFEARRRIRELEEKIARYSARSDEVDGARQEERNRFVDSLNETAQALERLGARLEDR